MYIVYTRILCTSKNPSRRSRATLNNTPTAVRTLSGNRNHDRYYKHRRFNGRNGYPDAPRLKEKKKKDNINQTLKTLGRCYSHSIGREKNEEECFQS